MLFLLAHLGQGEHGWIAGLLHPITGADHLVAAVAVGLLASARVAREPARDSVTQQPRAGSPDTRALPFPLAFLVGMTLGGALARLGIALPGVEVGIALSLVALGIALALRQIGPTWIAASVLALLALFHGHAHVAEYAATQGVAGYAAGLIVATALLHAAGVAIAIGADRLRVESIPFARFAGVATLAFGVMKISHVV